MSPARELAWIAANPWIRARRAGRRRIQERARSGRRPGSPRASPSPARSAAVGPVRRGRSAPTVAAASVLRVPARAARVAAPPSERPRCSAPPAALPSEIPGEQDTLVVRDLGSRNGTWVFLEAPHRLLDGDLLLIGSQVIRFRRLGYPGPHPPDADATRRMGSLIPSADIASLTQLRSDGS